MTLNKEITRLEKSNVKLTIKIAKNDVHDEYKSILSEYLKSVQLPGFRKGKVPREVLERKFGDSLKQEAMGRIMEKSLEQTLGDKTLSREERPLPYSRPEMHEEPKLDFDKDIEFSVVYDVLPQIKVEKWQGFEPEVPNVTISDKDISAELEVIRDRNAIVLDKEEEEKALKDDVVTVNYSELDEQGQLIPGTEREDFVFTLGSGQNIFKFDDEVIGMKKGESKDFEKTYPDNFENPDFSGKTKKLRVSVTAIKIKKLPELDDDLAQDVDEKFKTLNDLKNNIRERLSKNLEQKIKEIKSNKILESIMETTPVIIPDSMISFELDARWRNLARRFNTDTQGLYKIFEQTGQGPQALLDEWRPGAEKAIHSRLIVETLMEELKLEAPDEELEKEIETIAGDKDTAAQIRDYYKNPDMKEFLREEIRERKLFDILFEKNPAKSGKKTNYMDFMGNNE